MTSPSTTVASELRSFYRSLAAGTPPMSVELRGTLTQIYLEKIMTMQPPEKPSLPDGVTPNDFNTELAKAMADSNTTLVKLLSKFV